MKKTVLSVIVLQLLCLCLWGQTQISTPAQLNAVRNNLAGSYILTANIDISAYENWEPITIFTGRLNGNGHTVTGLTLNRSSGTQGLFGRIDGAVIENLGLIDVCVKGGDNTGGLVGYMTGTAARIYNCFTSGTVIGDKNVGGLVGNHYTSANTISIEKSYSSANVFGNQLIGGLLGRNELGSQISDCFATGSVTGGMYIGGLVGGVYNGAKIFSSYSTGLVTGAITGGLAAYRYETTYEENCYWNIETSNQLNSIAGIGLNSAEMTQTASFGGYNFANIWNIEAGNSYPFLRWQGNAGFHQKPAYQVSLSVVNGNETVTLEWNTPVAGNPIQYKIYRNNSLIDTIPGTARNYQNAELTNYCDYFYHLKAIYTETVSSNLVKAMPFLGFAGGDGTSLAPYEISDARQLNDVRYFMNKHFVLTRDINISDIENWQPIGTSSSDIFKCYFNGNGWTISGLTINRSSSFQGLFGYTCNAVIENLGLVNINVTGGGNTGGLVGYVSGLDSRINQCYTSGVVNGGNDVGGLVGNHYASNSSEPTITTSYSTATVSGNNCVGGLLGRNELGSYIADCYAVGEVNGNANVGGLTGGIYNGSKILRSYAIGAVNGVENTGGIAGYQYGANFVELTYWNTETSGQENSIGGAGRTTQQMTYPYSNTYSNWDFNQVWVTDSGGHNEGYPYLSWQSIIVDLIIYGAMGLPTEELIIPDTGVVTAEYAYRIYDRNGVFLEDEYATWSLLDVVENNVYNGYASINDSGVLSVAAGAAEGVLNIVAVANSNSSISDTLSVVLSYNIIEELDTPEIISITIRQNSIRLLWEEITGANYYLIFVSDDPSGEFPGDWRFLNAVNSQAGINEYIDTEPEQRQFYRIVASTEERVR